MHSLFIKSLQLETLEEKLHDFTTARITPYTYLICIFCLVVRFSCKLAY